MKFLEVKQLNESYEEGAETKSDEFKNQLGQLKLADTRRGRLTLMHLNKLRKIRERKKAEIDEKSKYLGVIYARAAAQ